MIFYKKLRQHFEDYLSEFVYGGIDGAVTTFAVVAGATGARFDTKVLLVLGFANLIADGFSMGVGSYLSTKSQVELDAKKGKKASEEPSPIINGITTYLSFILVGIVPLLAYTIDLIFDLNSTNLFEISIVLTALDCSRVAWLKRQWCVLYSKH
jgi:VIT1/CCC1 family predicted Fe2+/Mn2+ transporter